MAVSPGAHTLQVLNRLGLGSPVETFTVRAGETAAFACHSRPLQRGRWIALERTGGHEDGGGEGSSEQQRELVQQIQAAQANQTGRPL